jgi:hypothetical protein
MWRVSSLLQMAAVVSDDQWFYTPEGQERGRVVHMIGEQVFNKLEVVVSADYAGYETAIRKAAKALGIVPICVERRLVHPSRGFNGRPDVVGYLPRRVGRIPAGPALGDLKSGPAQPSHALQLGFYDILADANPDLRAQLPEKFRDLPWQRIGIYVHSNGRYNIVHYSDYSDRRMCESILDVTAWRQKHGCIDSVGDGLGSQQPDDDPFA